MSDNKKPRMVRITFGPGPDDVVDVPVGEPSEAMKKLLDGIEKAEGTVEMKFTEPPPVVTYNGPHLPEML